MTMSPHEDIGTVVRLSDVSLRYGKTLALDGVTLELPAGRIIGVIGPDGVGKSTLFNLVAGARALQDGKLEVLGGDMADRRHRVEVCPRTAFMPQGLGRNLYATLSVAENLEFFGRLFGQGKAERDSRIADLLASTGLAPFRDRRGGAIVGRNETEAGPLLRSDTRSRSSHPRRADDRRRSAVARSVLGADRSNPRFAKGHERDRRHRLYGRGRGLRPACRDERRPGSGARNDPGIARARRRRQPRGRVHRPDAGGAATRPQEGGHRRASEQLRQRRRDRGARADHALRRLHRRRSRRFPHSSAARFSAFSGRTAAARPRP